MPLENISISLIAGVFNFLAPGQVVIQEFTQHAGLAACLVEEYREFGDSFRKSLAMDGPYDTVRYGFTVAVAGFFDCRAFADEDSSLAQLTTTMDKMQKKSTEFTDHALRQ